jgi:hypothetical protein
LGPAGGSGIVIINSPTAATSTNGAPLIQTVSGGTRYTFTATGNITF